MISKKNCLRYDLKLIIIFVFAVFFILIGQSGTVASQLEVPFVPQWIKNNAGWWVEGKILDNEFAQGIQWLIEKGMITGVPISNNVSESNKEIPVWIKSLVGYWVDEKITNKEFLNAIQFLIKIEAIKESSFTNMLDKNSFREHEYSGYSPLFRTFAYAKDFVLIDGERVPRELQFEFKKDLYEKYSEIGFTNEKQSAVVVIPIFTSSAYWEPGFYTYYREECNSKCLTTKIEYSKPLGYSASSNAVKILKMLGYPTITDIDIDKNPTILQDYDKIILLHNEYVTKVEFEAITNHSNVIYLYPNALFAEISINYENDTIKLIRGHGYPESEIYNGFNWEFDNTHPFEFDNGCHNWKFYEIENGKMLNCFPENIIYRDELLLKTLKEL